MEILVNDLDNYQDAKNCQVYSIETGKPIEKSEKQVGKNRGKSTLVHPIKNPDDLARFIKYFENCLLKADTEYRKITAARNYLLIIIGLNTAYRISDIVRLTWGDLIDEIGGYKEIGIRKLDKKTERFRRYRTTKINNNVKHAIDKYLKLTNETIDVSNFIFRTCKSDNRADEKFMTEKNAYYMIKEAARVAEIKINIGTHTLRKTFGYWYYINAKNQSAALVDLMHYLGHSSQDITKRYIGIDDEQCQDMVDTVGDTYTKILDSTYQAARKDIVSISKEKLFEIIRMAYFTGKNDAGSAGEIDVDNINCLNDMLEENFV